MKKILLILFISFGGIAIAQSPIITSFSPATGAVGTLVTIKGNNLKNPSGIFIVGTAAVVVSSSDTQIVALVMPTASGSGNIYVYNGTGGYGTSTNFTITPTLQPEIRQNITLKSDYPSLIYQGYSTAISADGNTAVVGCPYILGGSITIYVREKNTWKIERDTLRSTNVLGTLSYQGFSVAISADGNTILVGNYRDSTRSGAAYVYTRNNKIWTEQAKLVGTGSVGKAWLGYRVSLSADGNTAVLGAPNDNNGIGATWIFSRTNGIWTQMGSKLSSSNYIGTPRQGSAVAISANGNYIAIGGYADNNNAGRVWIYNRNTATSFVQQYNIYSSTANAYYGYSVALNANGTTLAAGQPVNGNGKINIFTRTGTSWSYSTDLVANDATTGAELGYATSISADGNTIFAAADYQDQRGAFYIFKKVAGTWTQYGNARYSTDVTDSSFAFSVAISADGNTGIVGNVSANSYGGAAHIYVSPLPRITNFTPTVATSYQDVTINGIGFTGTTKVTFGGKNAYTFSVMSDTEIVARNNDGNSGYIAVTNNYGTDSIAGFTYCNSFYNIYNGYNYIVYNSDTIIHQGAYILFDAAQANTSFPPDSLCTFKWYKNNVLVGSNSRKYLDTTLATGDSVYCVVNFITPCASQYSVTLPAVYFTVLPNTPYKISTIAGSIVNGSYPPLFYGDGGQATQAALANPSDMALDKKRNVLYIADRGNFRVRKVNLTTGIITTYAGGGSAWLGDNGPATWASLGYFDDIALDSYGNLYIATYTDYRIRKVDTLGIITTVAGDGTNGYSGDGTSAVAAQIGTAEHIAIDNYDNLFIADNSNHVIRKVDKVTGIISTIAGKGVSGFSGDGGQAIYAKLNEPQGITFDKQNNLYITDMYNHRVRKVNASNGFINTVAGGGSGQLGIGDGMPATWVYLPYPTSVAVDTFNNLFITDANSNRIRKIGATDNTINTICGQGNMFYYFYIDSVYCGDGGPATAANINWPNGIITDDAGNIYFADEANGRIRKIDLTSADTTATVAGQIVSTKKSKINNVNLLKKTAGSSSSITIFGNYSIKNTLATNITLRPTKNNDIAKGNGVNSVDALLVQRHVLNTTKLNNAYKLIAADVDGNKAVNSVDVLRIKRLILGTDTTFKNTTTSENRLWAFVDSAYQFPDTTNPFPFKDSISFTNLTSNKTNQTFIGVKLGDVNFDWNSAVAKPSAVNCLPSTVNSQPSTENCVELFCQQTTVDSRPLTERSFAFSTLNSATLSALQTTIHFDNTKYEFVSINNNMFDIDFNTTQANTTGNISLVWIDKKGEAKEFKAGEELFSLQLRQRLTVSGQQFTDLQLNDDITPTAAYDEALNKRGITLVQKAVATNNLPFTTNNLTIYPNPTKGSFSIKLDNPISKGVLAITDVYGKQVYQEVLNKQSTIINCQLSKGMYCVNVITGKENQTQKLIVE